MAPPRPVHLGPRISWTGPILFQTFFILYTSYDLFRVYKGVHPVLSPKLANVGLFGTLNHPSSSSDRTQGGHDGGSAGAPSRRVDENGAGADEGGVAWVEVNGVALPLASFGFLTRWFRRE